MSYTNSSWCCCELPCICLVSMLTYTYSFRLGMLVCTHMYLLNKAHALLLHCIHRCDIQMQQGYCMQVWTAAKNTVNCTSCVQALCLHSIPSSMCHAAVCLMLVPCCSLSAPRTTWLQNCNMTLKLSVVTARCKCFSLAVEMPSYRFRQETGDIRYQPFLDGRAARHTLEPSQLQRMDTRDKSGGRSTTRPAPP